MEINPFLKRLMKDKKEDVVHSSAYGKAQNRGIGTASTETFAQRMKIERNRTTIRGYRDARIVNDALDNAPKAKTYNIKEDKMLNKNQASGAGNDTLRSNMSMDSRQAKPMASQQARSATPPPRRNPGIFR